MKNKKNREHKNTIEKRMAAACILLVFSAVLTLMAGKIPGMAEWYATHIYPVIVSTLGRISGIFSFSLSELCLYVGIVLLLGTLIHAIVLAARTKAGGAVMLKWASGVFLTASVLLFLYVTNCGINYRRISFSEKSGIQTSQYTAEDLKRVCLRLTEEVNARAGKVERDDSGVMKLSGPEKEAAVNTMNQLGTRYPAMAGYYPQPKGLLLSQILSYQSLTGIYLPFTVEANYNKDMTDYNIPFTACHELSHLRGFMQEEEANFIAFLACKDAQREDFQYSGYLMGWIYSMNALYKVDYEAWKEVRPLLAERVEADLESNSQFWAKYEGTLSEVSNKVNDTYLKVNGQSDGVQSYDRMVDLIVAYYQGN
ncbi:DUF3810 domain-containing protein [Faecalicatena sp. AGMB00832]|uniref:DUF3810 domain-containing protein n=1 Tax=Faecalicatena faecalis TaxID=2726362 RepID=A0ABS6DA00_9FIRM|nr:DUF3810 domain-containing protein [Faecalicatena faecalis]MBU3878448.1 DUF3810 domain-containing protein [Faecalicatena faecalis]